MPVLQDESELAEELGVSEFYRKNFGSFSRAFYSLMGVATGSDRHGRGLQGKMERKGTCEHERVKKMMIAHLNRANLHVCDLQNIV